MGGGFVAQRRARFLSSDRKQNVTAEVWAAFRDEGLPVLTLDEMLAERIDQDQPASEPTLNETDIQAMLAADGEWKLAVGLDSSAEVLTKDSLRTAWSGGSGQVIDVGLRHASPSEKLVLDSVPKLYAPDISYERLKEALALPVTQAALVATGAGLFGLLALRDQIAYPGAMKAAVVLATAAVVASLVGRYFLREVTVQPARLDLLEQRHRESIRGPLLRARVGLALLIAAVIAALVSTWPNEGAATEATISDPIVAEDAEGITAHLKITWNALPNNTAKVRSQVRSASATIYTRTTPISPNGGKLEDEFDVRLGGPASIDVTTVPLDKSNTAVADEASKSFDVP